MMIRKAEYFISEAIGSLKHNRLMALAAVTTMAISLLILGMFFVMVMNINHIASSIESQVQISAYLKDDVDEQQINDVGKRVAGIEGVASVKFVDKETALKMLKARLVQRQKEEEKSKLEAIEKKSIEWGSQIRSYVLHPYKMVKDHRTDLESPQPELVLDGDLMPFIEKNLIKEAGSHQATYQAT